MMSSPQVILITVLLFYAVATLAMLVWLVARNKSQSRIVKSLQKRIDELEHEKKQLSGVVTHDVRGPFNRIFALIQLIQISSGNLQKDQKEYLGKIHIMIADGLGLIRNLADSQKLEAKRVDLNLDKFNLSTVLSVLARNYKVLAEKKNILLQDDITPSLTVFSDRHYSNRIFDNLLSNAVKFSQPGSSVFITAKDDGAWVCVTVRDEGPGISQEDQSKLFRKFQTLSAKPTAGETSSGIGLSVVKALAEVTGAELSFVSYVGEGTTFTVRIRKEKTNPERVIN
jgi:signal transduction histidine kinase